MRNVIPVRRWHHIGQIVCQRGKARQLVLLQIDFADPVVGRRVSDIYRVGVPRHRLVGVNLGSVVMMRPVVVVRCADV